MIFKTIVAFALAFALVCAPLVSAADTTVLPAKFVPQGDVLACPSEQETIEFISALLVHDFAWVSASSCSVLSNHGLVVHELTVHVNIEMESEGCEAGPCIDTFVTGVYRAVAGAHYIVYVVGPDLMLEPTGAKEGIQADVDYEVVPQAPPSFELFMNAPPPGIAFASLALQ